MLQMIQLRTHTNGDVEWSIIESKTRGQDRHVNDSAIDIKLLYDYLNVKNVRRLNSSYKFISVKEKK